MKDKEKQIEEMARVLCNNNCPSCTGATCLALINAKTLINVGYKKIDKDSVVLSKEEYSKNLQTHYYMGAKDTEVYYGTIKIPQARKETAREILKRLIEIFSTAKGVCSGCALQHDKAKNPTAREFQFGKYKGFEVAEHEVKELAKQYGVGIKND